MLKDEIAITETQMKLELEKIRKTLSQSGDKGALLEDSFRKFLCKYLPRRLGIGHGEIVDSKGNKSAQTDIVMANEDHPFTFTPDLPGLFFIEGVCAAGEVKSTLTSKHLTNAIENSIYFKKLEIEPGKNTQVSSNPSDLERFYKCPPWFLIAFESQLDLFTIKARIEEFVKSNKIEPNRIVDAVFILDKGWAINFGDGKGTLQFRTPEGISIEGWTWKNSDSILFDLLGWLSMTMPRMIRFEPVLSKYLILTKKK